MLCVATTSLRGDLASKLQAASAIGFSGVELYEPDLTGFAESPTEIAKLAAHLDLKLYTLHPFHEFEGLEGKARKAAFQRLDQKLDLMIQLGVSTLMVGTTTHPDASGDRAKIIADFAELAKRVSERGLRAAIIALPWARHIQTEIEALDIIEEIDSPHLGLALNSYFSLADGSQAARLRRINVDRLFHVQLSDAPSLDFDITKLKSHFGVLPGQGELNLVSFVSVLAKLGYKGPWSVARIGNSIKSNGTNIAIDAYRSLVNLLDEVAVTLPSMPSPIPDLQPRVYPTGFEFIEFAADQKSATQLTNMLAGLCFRMERHHKSKSVELWRQGAINIVVNTEKSGFAADVFRNHGPSVCDMGLRVKDAAQTVARATALGMPQFSQPVGTGELEIPAIKGAGGEVVHFIDEMSDLHRVWNIEFDSIEKTSPTPPAGLRRIDHVAQTMQYQEMQSWLTYYTSTFELDKTPIVDVADPSGVILSQALSSPEGEVRLNLNGASEQRTFAGAFLADRVGAGVQHLAFLTDDIFETSDRLTDSGFERLIISPNYYADLSSRFDLDEKLIVDLQAGNILYDRSGGAEYFQIYSAPIFDGFFFEIVERRGGYNGYGARNAPIRLAAQMQYHRKKTAA